MMNAIQIEEKKQVAMEIHPKIKSLMWMSENKKY